MLVELVQTLTSWVQSLVEMFGALGIALVALMENLFPPTPSEFLYPLAGKLAYDNVLTPLEIVLAGVAGSLVGATLFYLLGYRLGEGGARAFLLRYGAIQIARWRWQIIRAEDYDRALELFKARGPWIVIIGRLMPLVHGVVSIPAGVVRIPYPLFFVLTALGSALWIAPLTALGYALGSQWRQILTWLDVYQGVWYIVFALMLLYYILWRVRHQRARSA